MTEHDLDLVWEARGLKDNETDKLYGLIEQAESEECKHKLSVMYAFMIRQQEINEGDRIL